MSYRALYCRCIGKNTTRYSATSRALKCAKRSSDVTLVLNQSMCTLAWAFSQALRKVLSFSEGPAMFAGDTNLREAEVKQEKLAKGVSLSQYSRMNCYECLDTFTLVGRVTTRRVLFHEMMTSSNNFYLCRFFLSSAHSPFSSFVVVLLLYVSISRHKD